MICRAQKLSISQAKEQDAESIIASEEILWEAVRRFRAKPRKLDDNGCHRFIAEVAKEYADKHYADENISLSDSVLYLVSQEHIGNFYFLVRALDMYIPGM